MIVANIGWVNDDFSENRASVLFAKDSIKKYPVIPFKTGLAGKSLINFIKRKAERYITDEKEITVFYMGNEKSKMIIEL